MSHLLKISHKKSRFLLLENFLRYTPWGHLSDLIHVNMSLHVTSTLNDACMCYTNSDQCFTFPFNAIHMYVCMHADNAWQETDGSRRDTNIEVKR